MLKYANDVSIHMAFLLFSNDIWLDGVHWNVFSACVSFLIGVSKFDMFGMKGDFYVVTPKKLISSFTFFGGWVLEIDIVLLESGRTVPSVYANPKNDMLFLAILHFSGL